MTLSLALLEEETDLAPQSKGGGGSSDDPELPTLGQLRGFAVPSDATPIPARRGHLGLCFACHQPVATHFDTDCRFVGCTAVDDSVTFVLVPVVAEGAKVIPHFSPGPAGDYPTLPAVVGGRPPHKKKDRGIQKARYFATAKGIAALAGDEVAPRRRQVLEAVVAAGETGIRAPEVKETAHLEHGSAQNALRWLRDKGAIIAVEAAHEDEEDDGDTTP